MKTRLSALVLMVLCSALVLSANQTLPQAKKLPRLDLNSLEMMKPNGEYVISVWKDGRWQEAGRLAFDKFLRERELDLSPFLAGGDAAKVRISEQGQGAAHIDSVLLGGKPPQAARGEDAGRILRKLSVKDEDIINAEGKSYELTFLEPPPDKTLKLTARIESAKLGTEPLQFPYDNLFTRISPSSKFYSYTLGGTTPPQGEPGSREWLDAVGRRTPLFRVVAPTGSGHPPGATYGWVSDDGKNLYVTLDFTPDNTFDGDKDYAKVFVKAGRSVKEFRVSVPERRWGTAHFLYTDKVVYEHKVYDFVIPLSELGAAAEDGPLQLAFAAYGTVTAASPLAPSLAYDPDHNRYLMVFENDNGSDSDIWGYLVDADGNIPEGADRIQISGEYGTDEIFPDVAYDSASGRFLVVWQDYRNPPTGPDIFGQLVNPDGELVGYQFPIKAGSPYESRPAVANDSVNGQFLVVWEDGRQFFNGSDIWGQLVSGEGGLAPPPVFTARAHPQSPANGVTDFIVSNALGDQTRPDVAFDSLGSEYLVVFQSQVTDGAAARIQAPDALAAYTTINGQFISWNGAPLYDDTDVNFLVSDPALEAVDPAVVDDNVNHRFLVAWADYPVGINATPSLQGTGRTYGLLENRWTQRTQAPPPDLGTLLSVSTHKSDRAQRTPGTARPQALPRAQAPLQDGDEQPFIYGQLVDTAGNLFNAERLVLSDEGENPHPDEEYLEELIRSNPALAFDSFCQRYLLFYFCRWWEGDGYVGEVEGRYLNSSGGIASDYLIAADDFEDDQIENRAPAVANNSVNHNFLVVWPALGLQGEPIGRMLFDPECAGLPEVTTTAVTDITPTSAKSGGNVTSDGGAAVTARGVCWNTTGGPTLSDSHTTNGSGLGSFPSQLTGLTPNTKYYVRAYATNSVGTAYGNELTFTTLKQFKVTFVAGSGGAVSGTLVQYVSEGGNCTPVEAQADAGFCFINWTGTTGFAGSSANPLTVTNVRQDMTITANFGSLGLVVQKLEEKAWIVKQFYGKVVLSVGGLDPTVPIRYVLNRKQGGGEYRALKEFNSSELQNNTYTYEDKFLEADVTYIYQVVAYNASGQVIGRSDEITVR